MNRKKAYIALIILAAAGLFLRFVTLPMIKTSKSTRVELSERKVYLADRKEIIKRIAELDEEKNQWEGQVSKLDIAFPIDSDLANVIFQFQNFAMDSGLIMKDINHNEQPSATISGGRELSINSNLIGSYTSLKSFFGKIEKNLRIIDIQRIDLAPEAETDQDAAGRGEPLFSANFVAKLYFFPTAKSSDASGK